MYTKNLRKVKIKAWIPNRYSIDNVNVEEAHFENDFNTNGLFHTWGLAYEEFQTGTGNYSVALVEMMDGTISEVIPNNIKFID